MGEHRMKLNLFALTAIQLASIIGLNQLSFAGVPVIYGEDDRKDLYAVINPLHAKLADSTVVLMKGTSIQQNSSGQVRLPSRTMQSSMGVCSNERFANQPNAGFCSGSLIGKNLILTAGHCIRSAEDCSTTKFVFGYHVKQEGVFPTSTSSSEVYGCKRIIVSEVQNAGADFAVVETDREVVGHEPLTVAKNRMQSTIEKGTKLVMIGHPSGLPVKIDDGAAVRDPNQNGYFIATTDSYGGNSGSSVFNLLNGEIEGVLVRGETDFVRGSQGCMISNVCAENGCRGEDVTKIASVLAKLPRGMIR